MVFGAETLELKMQKRVGFLDTAQAYIIGPVTLAGVTLLYLFQVAEIGAGGAFAKGEGAVGKVNEQLTAVQVVGADGLGGVAPFGGYVPVPGWKDDGRFLAL